MIISFNRGTTWLRPYLLGKFFKDFLKLKSVILLQMSKLNAVKRQHYFSRVRKRWKRRDVREIDESHPKYLFTQYISAGMRAFLTEHNRRKVMYRRQYIYPRF